MGSEWKVIQLNQFVKHQKGFAFKSKDYVSSGIPVVRVSNFTDDSIDISDFKYVSSDIADEKIAFELVENDVVIATVGSWPKNPASVVGKVIRVPITATPSLLNQNAVVLRPISGEKYDKDFLFYLLKNNDFSNYIISTAQGSANQASITLKDIYAYSFPLPNPEERKVLSNILRKLDNKITLNRQINQTLEQMAQTLFKSWFVDFDPVVDNALDAGFFEQDLAFSDELLRRVEIRKAVRESDNFKPLSEDIRRLFPDAFEECAEPALGLGGWVPKGWQEVKLTDLVYTVSKTYPLKTVKEVIFLNTGDIENGSFLHTTYSPVNGLPGQAKKSIQKGDILFSEIRPKNKRFAFVNFESNDYVVSTKLMVLRAKNNFNPLFAYFLLTLNETTDELQRIAELRSGTFPQITFNELSLIKFFFPAVDSIVELFSTSYLEPFFEKSSFNGQESESLTKLRDTLLPKLISGELSLSDIKIDIPEETLI
ncbi:TPA: restriction endonuclease subunit S [Proteus mirabilis]